MFFWHLPLPFWSENSFSSLVPRIIKVAGLIANAKRVSFYKTSDSNISLLNIYINFPIFNRF